jgi:hypothetical protein
MLCCTAGWAADTFHPLDVKPGQWESTMSVVTTGAPPIPSDVLARMTPEMRAKMEERLKGKPIITKSCVKQEDLDKPLTMGHDDKACSRKLISSSSSKQEIHVECSREKTKSSGTILIEAMNSENVKGTVQMTSTTADRTMNIDSSFTAHWIGPTCSKEK